MHLKCETRHHLKNLTCATNGQRPTIPKKVSVKPTGTRGLREKKKKIYIYIYRSVEELTFLASASKEE